VTDEAPIRFAVVTEGPSDFLVLRAVIASTVPGAEVVPLHPDVPLSIYPEYGAAAGRASRGTGWMGVQSWCRDYGPDLDLFMRADLETQYDALVIHVDASTADKLGLERDCPPANATTDLLRSAIVRDWLGIAEPPYLVLATPSKCTEAWVVAALSIDRTGLECDKAVENILVRKRLLRKKDGLVKKPRNRYEPLAHQTGAKLKRVRAACSEADRFVNDVARVVGGCRPAPPAQAPA
jgi:hypothetical protein